MSTSCQPCQAHEERAQHGLPSGTYSFSCVRCCARLVRSARPLLNAQEAMLAAITRRPGRPTRQQIMAAIDQLDLVTEQTEGEDLKPEHQL